VINESVPIVQWKCQILWLEATQKRLGGGANFYPVIGSPMTVFDPKPSVLMSKLVG